MLRKLRAGYNKLSHNKNLVRIYAIYAELDPVLLCEYSLKYFSLIHMDERRLQENTIFPSLFVLFQ